MLAKVLQKLISLVGGYNSWIDQGFNIDQGFDMFTSTPCTAESLDEGKPDGSGGASLLKVGGIFER
jgi:hypothetical protein